MLRPRSLAPLCAAALSATFFGCDQYPPANQPSGCGANTAMVGVKDDYLLDECGCDEAAGKTKLDGNSLTCTVPKGTWVVFDMTSTKHIHQVISVGTPSFTSGPVRDPSNDSTPVSHAAQFTSVGTFQFQDRFETGLNGQIIVR